MNIDKDDLNWAALQGCISHEQAQKVWELLLTKKSHQQELPPTSSGFNLSHIAYYLGALIVLASLGWFVGLEWERFGGAGLFFIALLYASIFLIVGHQLWKYESLKTPGGLFITLAVCMTPLAIYGIQQHTGWWVFDKPGSYRDFFHWIKGGWFFMEVGTLITATVALYYYRFPFLTAPLFFTLWFMSMDITPLLFGSSQGQEESLWVSLFFGLAILIAAFLIDNRAHARFAFWGYLFGMMAFWSGLSLLDLHSEWARLVYCLINLILILLAPLLQQKIFLIFGGLGLFSYISSLFYRLFYNSVLFPFALSAAGILIIFLGILYQKYHLNIEQALFNALPDSLKSYFPQRPKQGP